MVFLSLVGSKRQRYRYSTPLRQFLKKAVNSCNTQRLKKTEKVRFDKILVLFIHRIWRNIYAFITAKSKGNMEIFGDQHDVIIN